MTALASDDVHLLARPATGSFSSIPTTRFEQAVGVVVMFVLAFNVPNVWLALPQADFNVGGSAETQQFALLAVVAIFGFVSLGFAVGPYVQTLRGEPLLLGFLALVGASVLWSPVPTQTFHTTLLLVATTAVAAWLVVRFSLAQIIGMAGAVFAISTTVQMAMIAAFPAHAKVGAQWVGLLKNRNVFGRSESLALLILLLCTRLFPRYRAITWLLISANVVMLLKADSKTSLVAAVATPAMFATFTVFRSRRTLYGAVAIVMGTATGAIVLLTATHASKIAESLDRSPDLSSRTPIWTAVMSAVRERPVLGHGWDGFFTPDTSGPARHVYAQLDSIIPHSHDALLDVAVYLGLVGVVVILLVFVRLVIRGARIVRFYQGAVGMFPLMYAGYVLLISITEYGVLVPDLHFLLFVVAVAAASPGRRDELTRVFNNRPDLFSTDRASSSRLRRPSPRLGTVALDSTFPARPT